MADQARPPIRVLVVDDEAAIRDAYRQIFSEPEQHAQKDARRSLGAKLFGAESGKPGGRPAASTLTFDATYCDGAEAAVAAVQAALDARQPYAVAFLDMRMPPGHDGVWAAARIRELDPAIEIAVCTAYSDVDPCDIGGQVPPEDKLSYLQKPFHPHEVRQMAIALASKWGAERRITQLAYFDSLTGLPNREQVHNRLRTALASTQRQGRMLAVMYMDLDNFKRVNDTLGHAVGDEVLKVAADRLRKSLRQGSDRKTGGPTIERPGDLGRLGGDEFLVILPDIASSDDAKAVAERLIAAIQQPMELTSNTVIITPSIGIAVAPTDGTDAAALLRHGDLAMYFAKRRWPGSFAFFDASRNEGMLQRYTIESKLRGALECGEFSLHYQPQVETATGDIAGMEALLRWTNDELGVVPPMDFIPIAESTGLIIPIGEWVLRTACAQAKTWHDEGLAVKRIAVNIAAQQFAMPDFVELVSGILAETDLEHGMLELEITESMVMTDEKRSEKILGELRAIGVSVAIDDFGTGYSNFQRLQHLAIDRLKMDRSFVRDLSASPDDGAIAAAIINVAKALKVGIVAEGVESFAQLRFLQDHSCNQAQGFLLSRALPANEARLVLQRATEQFDGSRTQRIKRLSE
jgi:diguanylate cyclase (GGDEF)-like protein